MGLDGIKSGISTIHLQKKRLKILFYISCQAEHKIITQKNIANDLKIPSSTINSHIRTLKKEGLLKYNNELSRKGRKAIRFFNHWDKTLEKKLRAHKIQVSITIQRLPSNFFTLKHKILSPFTNKKYRGLKGTIQGSKVMFYSTKKLIVKVHDVLANTSEEIVSIIIDSIEQIYKVLQMEFPGLVLGDYEICKFNSMHCAVLNSTIAESFLLKKGSTFQSKHFCIDGSHKGHELEAEVLENIFETTDILVDFEDLVAKLKSSNHNNISKDRNFQAENETNNMQMQENITLPPGYGTYFM